MLGAFFNTVPGRWPEADPTETRTQPRKEEREAAAATLPAQEAPKPSGEG